MFQYHKRLKQTWLRNCSTFHQQQDFLVISVHASDMKNLIDQFRKDENKRPPLSLELDDKSKFKTNFFASLIHFMILPGRQNQFILNIFSLILSYKIELANESYSWYIFIRLKKERISKIIFVFSLPFLPCLQSV